MEVSEDDSGKQEKEPLSFLSSLPNPVTNVPKYIVNLDLPPSKRWSIIVKDFKHEFDGIRKYIDEMIKGLLGSTFGSVVKKVVSGFLNLVNRTGAVFFSEELKAIAEQTGQPLGEIVLLQLSYELFATCTSILKSDSNGNVLHCRTMDWDMPALKKLTIEVEFQRGGNPVFYGTTWAGYVGVLTGMRPSAYTVAVNFRRTEKGTFWQNIKQSLSKGWPIGFLVRQVLDEDSTFLKAVGSLSSSKLISPCYFTMAGSGKNEGVIITRDREHEENRWTLSEHGDIVQPNIDHWSSDPQFNIIWSIERRDWTRSCFKEMELKNINADFSVMRDILQQYPCWNDETIYATFMCPKQFYYASYLPPLWGGSRLWI